ncbi:MAG: hypothetical protein ACTSPY_06795 [Candidatus Helarchaeota archaeon]
MAVSKQMYENKKSELEEVEVLVNKKYLELFKEICEEKGLDYDKELKSRIENALFDSFNSYHSECLREDRALGFLKGGKACKRIPGFDLENIKRILSKMDSIDEQIDWLKNYLEGLQKTKEVMYFGPSGLPTTMTKEQQFTGLTPYMKAVPQAIEEINKIIRALEAEKIVREKITHKF